ncbi:hypothetical protein Efla_002111 [Eimeria flavescens]
MTCAYRVWIASVFLLLCSSCNVSAEQSKSREDVVLNGVSEEPPPAGYNPFLAKVHMNGSEAFPSLSGGSLSQQTTRTSGDPQAELEIKEKNEEDLQQGGISALQTSQDTAECSCMFAVRKKKKNEWGEQRRCSSPFAVVCMLRDSQPHYSVQTLKRIHFKTIHVHLRGVCLYKGACLWVATTMVLSVIFVLFFIAWALQWVVAIPAEYVSSEFSLFPLQLAMDPRKEAIAGIIHEGEDRQQDSSNGCDSTPRESLVGQQAAVCLLFICNNGPSSIFPLLAKPRGVLIVSERQAASGARGRSATAAERCTV